MCVAFPCGDTGRDTASLWPSHLSILETPPVNLLWDLRAFFLIWVIKSRMFSLCRHDQLVTSKNLQKPRCSVPHPAARWEPAVDTCGCKSCLLVCSWLFVLVSWNVLTAYIGSLHFGIMWIFRTEIEITFKYTGRGTSVKNHKNDYNICPSRRKLLMFWFYLRLIFECCNVYIFKCRFEMEEVTN